LQVRSFLSKKIVHAMQTEAHTRRNQMQRMLDGVRAAGLKLTPQRMAIVRELATDESHPTAQELYDRLRPALPTMSFATVYNTLDALAAAGLCNGLALSPGSSRFDPNMQPHHHLVCDACGAVRDLPTAAGPAADTTDDTTVRRAASRAAPGFEVRAVERILRGLCAECAGRAPAAGGARSSNERAWKQKPHRKGNVRPRAT
jgi:Fur family peroxide stress response transcriptional regulator